MPILASLFSIMGPDLLIILVVLLLFLGGPILGAYFLDQRHRRARPNCRPFGWGYYNALGAFLAPIFVAGQIAKSEASAAGIVFFVAACIYIPLGILTLRRNGWGYVILTVLSLNPLLWIINAIYINNRWREFQPAPPVAYQPPPSLPSPPPPPPALPQSIQLEENLYFHLNDNVQGPFSPQQVQSLVQVGTVGRDTLCCIEGGQDWQPFHTFFGST